MTTAKSSRATRTKASTRKVSSRAARSAGSRSPSEETSKTSTPPAEAKAKPTPRPDLPPEEDPIPEGIRKLVDLFQGPLQTVSFPDVDREILEERCDALRDADADVRRLFLDLETAQERLNSERASLEKCAERGLAYAQVFSVGNEELATKLGEISLGSGKKSARKPKARVPKARKGDATTPPPAPDDATPPSSETAELSADGLVENEVALDETSKISA